MIVAFRTDASLQIGSGHVMRCLTLADELKKAGAKITFITRDHPGNLNQLIKNKGHNLEVLSPPSISDDFQADSVNPRSEYLKWLGVPELRDASETIAKLEKNKPSWLIVDHYGLGLEWELALRPHIEKLMVIDDLADRKHDCDVLLDQNYFVEGDRRYAGLVPEACRLLVGPRYALLRPEYTAYRKTLRDRDGQVRRVLVFFGGTDPQNMTGMAIEALSRPGLKHLEMDIVVGVNNPHRKTIEQQVLHRPHTILHEPRPHLADLMVQADLALGAGGTTTWERLCLGLPSLVVSIAENQVPSCIALHRARLVNYLGYQNKVDSTNFFHEMIHMIDNPRRLVDMSLAGQALVDGFGADSELPSVFRSS